MQEKDDDEFLKELMGLDSQLNVDEPTVQQREQWHARLRHYHRSSGHPTNRSLARLLKEAGRPEWQVKMALELKCDACDAAKPGGSASGQVPPASTAALPEAWTHIGVDVGEFPCPEHQCKVKFLLVMDLATKLRKVIHLFTFPFEEARNETGEQVVEALATGWLADKPKPQHCIFDAAHSFESKTVVDFLGEMNICAGYTPEKEPWAHGIVERAMAEIKDTAQVLVLDNPGFRPELALQLSASANNGVEVVKGYTPIQWAYGKAPDVPLEELAKEASGPEAVESHQDQYSKLVDGRLQAEKIARQVRARRALSKLSNSTVRQPVRVFNPGDLVKVWRKAWPQEAYRGSRGGLKRSIKPHWIGPGKVVLQETRPGAVEGDPRRHLTWVVVGTSLFRCSTHSVRLATDRERLAHELAGGEGISGRRDLTELLQNRHYTDISEQIPEQTETEAESLLPEAPNSTTVLRPAHRAVGKRSVPMVADERRDATGLDERHPKASRSAASQPPKNESEAYEIPPSLRADTSQPIPEEEEDMEDEPVGTSLDATSRGSKRPFTTSAGDEEQPSKASMRGTSDGSQQQAATGSGNETAGDSDMDGLRAHMETTFKDYDYELFTQVLEEEKELDCMVMEFDLNFTSNRQKKKFLRNPELFLVGKMRSTEVNYKKLTRAQQHLFDMAKAKEVSQFVQNQAVRRAQEQEQHEAWDSGRILKARWVLTWKPIPEDEQAEAV